MATAPIPTNQEIVRMLEQILQDLNDLQEQVAKLAEAP